MWLTSISKVHNAVVDSAKYLLSGEHRALTRIRNIPRYTAFTTDLPGVPITGVDSASFVHSYSEIFKREIYRFTTVNNAPKIIDCGANIGLSVIYFKRLYPAAKIVAFEADP